MAALRAGGALVQRSARGQVNYMYAIDASQLLGIDLPDGDPATLARYRALVDWPPFQAGRRGAYKTGVLAELGRAARTFDPDFVRCIADKACERIDAGWTAREVELAVRSWRLKLTASE